MIKTTIEAYDQKAYVYNEDEKWLYVDGYKFKEMATKNNKNAKYWTDHDVIHPEEWYEI